MASSEASSLVAAGDARRSTRVAQAVPLAISGQDRIGNGISERTAAVVVNCHGCRFPSRHHYRPGSSVNLELSSHQLDGKPCPVRGRVRYIHLPRNPQELYQVGIELETPANIWGIQSPPEDWLRFPGSMSAAAGAARAVARTPQPRITAPSAQRIHVLPSPVTEVAASESASFRTGAGDARGSAHPSAPGKPARVIVTPDQLMRALEGKLQQAAEKAVAAALASHLKTAVDQAVKTIENASQASTGRVEERWAQHRAELVASARQEFLGRLQADLRDAAERAQKELEASLSHAEATTQRLEETARQIQPALTEAQDFLQEAVREMHDQFAARLRETEDRAAADFGDETVRLSDRQLARLAEKAQVAAGEAATRLETRAAEACAQIETAASAALAEFREKAAAEIDRSANEARQSVESSMATFAAQTRADWEARQHGWEEDLARLSDQRVEQFRELLETILNSWLVPAMSAVNEHSRALLESLAAQARERLQQAGRGPTSA